MMMKYMSAVLLLLVPVGEDESPRPTPADFIQENARPYFRAAADGEKYWGAETSGWRAGLKPVATPWTYVDEGGRGEFVELQLAFFTTKLDWRQHTRPESFQVTVRIAADGLPDHVYTERLERTGMSGNSAGVSWSFSPSLRCLDDLEEHWGRLPSKIFVSLALAEKGFPAASTSAAPVVLVAIPQKQATWPQLVHTLKIGQTRAEVQSLLGPALSEKLIQRADGSRDLKLTYPNPDAPAEWPPEMRLTFIFLDQRGKFRVASLYGGC
jgi:hypothetical protein